MNKIGIDIGRVIIASDTDSSNSFFGDGYLNTPSVSHSLESIKKIVDILSPQNVFLVSKCSTKTEKRTKEWLLFNSFFVETRIHDSNLIFCRKRSEKYQICLDNKINIFIDDRYSVLQCFSSFFQLFLFDPLDDEFDKYSHSTEKSRSNIELVYSWGQVLKHFLVGRSCLHE